MPNKMNPITERIAQLLKKFGYTEYRLSLKADIKNATLNNAMKGPNSWIQATYLYRISKVFDVSLEYLITGEKTKFDENKRISELKDNILDLKKECEALRERNKKLEKAVQALAVSES
jgi:transcriptional regulator with XRE-family HTH domain